ncbi:hypothetical protein U9M48_018857 [Paspalum notatum var. saurae]|uniref:F-box domain-containing protein n=1 Tax=Paspalum notatum var. saurae TaxID=547442 RepID=A0AAQ3TBI3_PASNO
MGQDCRGGGGRRHDSIDRISSLPDDLLHCILLRLKSTRAAGRTSVLSRRWRHVWAHLPYLRLGTCLDELPAATRLDSVDAALAAFSAPALKRLEVALYCHGLRVHARRVASWLRFASQRRVRDLSIYVPPQTKFFLSTLMLTRKAEEAEELQLPAWDAATTIALSLEPRWTLRFPAAAGLFTALTDLYITLVSMEGGELGAFVSAQCPRLRNLHLSAVTLPAASSDVCIRSDSLHSLSFHVDNAQRLQVIAPNLEELTVSDAMDAHISAPKLAERFDKVDALKLTLNLCDLTGTAEGFKRFMDQTIRLPKCDTLRLQVSLVNHHHNFTSTILHLLRRCDNTRKVSVKVNSGCESYPCPSSCLCRLPESCKADGITLDSLEEVKITFVRSSYQGMEFLEQLARCHAPSLKTLVINCELFRDGRKTKELEEVCRMFYPDIVVRFSVI